MNLKSLTGSRFWANCVGHSMLGEVPEKVRMQMLELGKK